MINYRVKQQQQTFDIQATYHMQRDRNDFCTVMCCISAHYQPVASCNNMAESVASKVVEDVDELSVFGLDAHTLLRSKPDALSEVTHCLQPCSRFVANQNRKYQPTSLSTYVSWPHTGWQLFRHCKIPPCLAQNEASSEADAAISCSQTI